MVNQKFRVVSFLQHFSIPFFLQVSMKAASEATEPGLDHGVPKVLEGARRYPDHNSSSTNSSRSPAALIDGYAQDLAQRILLGAGPQGPPEPPQARESLAGQLASLTLQAALKEASEGGGADGEEEPGCPVS